MSELSRGNWQPWNNDGSRHICHTSRKAGKDSGKLSTAMLGESSAETFLTRCPWCRNHVYYHTNGYGDTVYFDNLGWPWQIHPCWKQYWSTQKNGKKVLRQLQSLNERVQKQRLLLLGVLQKLAGITKTPSGLYPVSEESIARRMGLPLEQLQKTYGHLYSVSVDGIALIDAPSLKLEIVAINPPGNSPLTKNIEDGMEKRRCPICNELKLAFRLEKHEINCRLKLARKRLHRKSGNRTNQSREAIRLTEKELRKHQRSRKGE